MAKPQPLRFPSDDCPVSVGGTIYYPHEGEYVELFPVASVAELATFGEIFRLGVDMNAAKGEPDEAVRIGDLLSRHFDEACNLLAGRVVAWDWTDLRGQPYGQPSVEVIRKLAAEEIIWLIGLSQNGETPTQRKKGLPGLPTMSSDTQLPVISSSKMNRRNSTTDRSHTKRQ